MKNLNKKYLIQQQKLLINCYSYNKNYYSFEYNLIGYWTEYFDTKDKENIDNEHRYNHIVLSDNLKLYKKFPHGILKKNYKQWLYNNKRFFK